MAIWKDINITLDKKASGDIKDWKDENSLKESLSNILRTMQGERRGLPSFGSSLYNLLFEPMSSPVATLIGQKIYDEVQRWEPRIEITNVHVNANTRRHIYEVTINFILSSQPDMVYEVQEILYAR